MKGRTRYFIKMCRPLATPFTTFMKTSKNVMLCQSRIPEIVTCQIFFERSIASIQEEFNSKCRALGPCRSIKSNSNLSLYQFNLLNTFKRTFMFGRRGSDLPKKRKKRIPKLILIQNPFTWLMTKIDLGVLRHVWDPTFQEKEFKFGTRQAISRVTQVISDGHFYELNGLLTKAARLCLLRELDENWSGKQRALFALKQDDIQISSPRKVSFIRIADKKFCDVDMTFIALKWVPVNNIDALLLMEIFARFHREYTPHCIPEWTIAYFKVTRFEVMRR